MRVRIVEARQDRLPAQVHFARERGRERQDIIVRAHQEKAASADRDGLRPRHLFVHCPDVPVVENYLWLNTSSRQERQRGKSSESRKKRSAGPGHPVVRMYTKTRFATNVSVRHPDGSTPSLGESLASRRTDPFTIESLARLRLLLSLTPPVPRPKISAKWLGRPFPTTGSSKS